VDNTYQYCIKNCDNQLIQLQRSTMVKDLCILFDEKLTFKEHIPVQEKISTAYMMLGIIKHNFKYLTIDSLVFPV